MSNSVGVASEASNGPSSTSKTEKLQRLMLSLLPGIFLIGYNVGTGSVTAMSKAGANFGTDLLWAVCLSCLMTYYLMSVTSKFTIVTGYTLIEGSKKLINPILTIGVIVALSVIILSALIGILGIITDVFQIWLSTMFSLDVSRGIATAAIATTAAGVLIYCNTASFEKLLALLVALMSLAFITTTILEFPGWQAILQGFIPSIPSESVGSDNHPLVVVAGVVGTTVSVFVFIIRTGIVKEKNWTTNDFSEEKRDAAFSAVLMFIVSAAVLITAAATLNAKGLAFNSIAEMIPMLEPVFGSFALSIFVIGVLSAGISSHLPNLLVIPWLIDDYQGIKRNTQSFRNKSILICLTVFSCIGVSFGLKPVFLMLLSQAAISVILPVVLGMIIYLTSTKAIMGEHKNKAVDGVILTAISCFSLYMSYQGVLGLIADLSR